MNFWRQILHVFRKDVLRLWPYLLGVSVVWVLHVRDGLPSLATLGLSRLPVPLSLLPLLLGIGALLVVHEDSPADDRSFWPTRPLRPGATLAAKAAFIGLFLCVLPVVAQAIWFRSLGAEGPLFLPSLDSAVAVGSILAMFAAGAALTRTLQGFLGLALSFWLGVELLRVIATPDAPTYDYGVGVTRAYLQDLVWLAVGAGILSRQYVTRQTTRTLVLGAAAIVVLLPVTMRSPLDFSIRPDDELERFAYALADSMEFGLVRLERDRTQMAGQLDGEAGIRAEIHPEPGVAARLDLREVASRVSGGGIDRGFRLDPTGAGNWPPAMMMGSRPPGMRPFGRMALQEPRPNYVQPWIAVGSEDELDQLSAAERLELTLSFDVYHPRVLGFMPPKAGARLKTPEGIFEVEAVRWAAEGVRVDVSQRMGVVRALRVRPPFSRDGTHFVIYNPERNEYLPANGGGGGGTGGLTLLGGAHFEHRMPSSGFSPGPALDPGEEFPDDWFDDARVAIIGEEYAGSFTRTLTREVPEWPSRGTSIRVEPRPR